MPPVGGFEPTGVFSSTDLPRAAGGTGQAPLFRVPLARSSVPVSSLLLLLSTPRARTNTVILPHPKTRIPTFSSTISPLFTPSNRHFRARRVPKHPPTSSLVRAPVTARPWVEACQFPRASSFGLPTAGPRTRAGLPRRFSRDPSSTPKRWLGQQAREDTSAWHRLPSLCDTSGALHTTRCPKLCQRRRAQPPTHRR